MDFQFTEEQQQLRQTVRKFAEREIAPHVMEWDEAACFPLATIKELGRLGLMGAIFPVEFCGAGMGYMEYAMAIEELSRVDGSVGIIVAAHTSLCTNHIFVAGNQEQKRKYVPRLASGELHRCLGAHRTRLRLRCRRRALLGGAGKRQVGAERNQDFLHQRPLRRCVRGARGYRQNRPNSQPSWPLGFRRRKGNAGFQTRQEGKQTRTAGQRTAELIFEDCEVPAENLLGHEGHGFVDAMRILDGGRISIAALGLGMAQGAYDCALCLLQAAPAVRQSHQRVSSHPVEAGGHGNRNRSRPPAHPARRVDER